MSTKVEVIRAKYWRLRSQLDASMASITPTLDRQIQLAQLEIQTEIAVQLAEINDVLARIGVLNFEEIALRLEELLEKGKVLTTDGNLHGKSKV